MLELLLLSQATLSPADCIAYRMWSFVSIWICVCTLDGFKMLRGIIFSECIQRFLWSLSVEVRIKLFHVRKSKLSLFICGWPQKPAWVLPLPAMQFVALGCTRPHTSLRIIYVGMAVGTPSGAWNFLSPAEVMIKIPVGKKTLILRRFVLWWLQSLNGTVRASL